ncbi:MAG: DUF2007 domain-containing protein [Rikenellaceae bacterium]|nr:DUF2007 domain-containing protein [Rikenellaceae bacterium]
MQPTKLIVILRCNDIERLAIARSILDNAEIFSTIRNEYMATILPIGEEMAAELLVEEKDIERATKLLKNFL